MNEIGYVSTIKKNYATVVFNKKSGCGDNCAHCKSACGGSLVTMDIENTLNASIGDKIEVEIKTDAFNKMTLLAYVLPTIMTLIGLIGGIIGFKNAGFENYEILSVLTGCIMLGISYYISGKVDKNMEKDDAYKLKMVKLIRN